MGDMTFKDMIDRLSSLHTNYVYDEGEESYECQTCDEFFYIGAWERTMWTTCPICGHRIIWHDEGSPFEKYGEGE